MEPSKPFGVPLGLGMILADYVWREPTTGKPSILGLFDTIRPERYPFVLPSLAVHCVFSGGRGMVPIKVWIVAAQDANEEPLVVAGQDLNFSGPRTVLELPVIFHNVAFSRPGEYLVQARCAGEVLLERRLFLLPPQASEP